MRIAVVDGQGGGIGKALVERLRIEFGNDIDIIALGTNALATSLMLRAGADEGASGENAIVYNAGRVDVILGAIGIIAADSMLGELTAQMARAIAASPAQKILIPMNRCNIQVAGVRNAPLPQYIDEAAAQVKAYMENRQK
ncbi:MAG TPA: DUF3842 family protein [Clostridia bacterium]|nr:DUF3842 family protein [Clostridia bacterium]